MMLVHLTGISDLQKPVDRGFVAEILWRMTRWAIPLYLLKSSVSLQFLKLFMQANETTHWSTDVNRVVE
jgi:hypothetical protein